MINFISPMIELLFHQKLLFAYPSISFDLPLAIFHDMFLWNVAQDQTNLMIHNWLKTSDLNKNRHKNGHKNEYKNGYKNG